MPEVGAALDAKLDANVFFAVAGFQTAVVVALFGWSITEIRDLRRRLDGFIDRGRATAREA